MGRRGGGLARGGARNGRTAKMMRRVPGSACFALPEHRAVFAASGPPRPGSLICSESSWDGLCLFMRGRGEPGTGRDPAVGGIIWNDLAGLGSGAGRVLGREGRSCSLSRGGEGRMAARRSGGRGPWACVCLGHNICSSTSSLNFPDFNRRLDTILMSGGILVLLAAVSPPRRCLPCVHALSSRITPVTDASRPPTTAAGGVPSPVFPSFTDHAADPAPGTITCSPGPRRAGGTPRLAPPPHQCLQQRRRRRARPPTPGPTCLLPARPTPDAARSGSIHTAGSRPSSSARPSTAFSRIARPPCISARSDPPRLRTARQTPAVPPLRGRTPSGPAPAPAPTPAQQRRRRRARVSNSSLPGPTCVLPRARTNASPAEAAAPSPRIPFITPWSHMCLAPSPHQRQPSKGGSAQPARRIHHSLVSHVSAPSPHQCQPSKGGGGEPARRIHHALVPRRIKSTLLRTRLCSCPAVPWPRTEDGWTWPRTGVRQLKGPYKACVLP